VRRAFAFAFVVAAACESGADVVEEMRPRAETRLAAMQSATKAAIEKPVAFDEFLAVKWLVVVGNAGFNAGAVTGDSTSAGGGWNGTLHFVEIDEGGSVGSITVDASASDTVEVVGGREAEHLSSDVWINARAAINDGLAPFTASGDKPL
jgi:hypothetical protein